MLTPNDQSKESIDSFNSFAGNVSIAFVEENAIDVNGQRYGGRVLGYQVPKGSSVTVPMGVSSAISHVLLTMLTISCS